MSQGPTGKGGNGAVLCTFSNCVGAKDSNEVEVLTILEALVIFLYCSF